MVNTMCDLFGIARRTYFHWKKNENKNKSINLVEKSFTEEELEQYLKTGEIPIKIKWANNKFNNLYESFTRYIVNSEGSKALLSAMYNNENMNNIDDLIVQEYNNKTIDQHDMISYFNDKPLSDLWMYIQENNNNNWMYYKNATIDKGYEWCSIYLDIVLLSIKKGIYDMVFSNRNKNNDYCIVPFPPKLFSCYAHYEEIEKKYFDLLKEIYSALKNDDYKNIKLYDSMNSFDLNTVPATYQYEGSLKGEYLLLKDKETVNDGLELGSIFSPAIDL